MCAWRKLTRRIKTTEEVAELVTSGETEGDRQRQLAIQEEHGKLSNALHLSKSSLVLRPREGPWNRTS
jgi:hypothetical protein